MDEHEVNRRDAVAGLGLLSALAVMLVVTIFYRIINPSPPAKASLDGLTIAAEPSEPTTPFASQPPGLSGDAPIQHDGDVGTAAFEGDPSATGSESQPEPTFVAPTGR